MTPGFSALTFSVQTSDGRNFVLLEPVTYTAQDGTAYVIPAGATSDGASTPREIWLTVPPFGRYWPAAFLHDYLYRCTDIPKMQCDDLLMEAMVVLGVAQIEAEAIYRGVDLFGKASFNADRAARAALSTWAAAPAISPSSP